ncbi:MAG: hypothetical protein ABW032_10335, partial [Burkholderiaceae bacterium]
MIKLGAAWNQRFNVGATAASEPGPAWTTAIRRGPLETPQWKELAQLTGAYGVRCRYVKPTVAHNRLPTAWCTGDPSRPFGLRLPGSADQYAETLDEVKALLEEAKNGPLKPSSTQKDVKARGKEERDDGRGSIAGREAAGASGAHREQADRLRDLAKEVGAYFYPSRTAMKADADDRPFACCPNTFPPDTFTVRLPGHAEQLVRGLTAAERALRHGHRKILERFAAEEARETDSAEGHDEPVARDDGAALAQELEGLAAQAKAAFRSSPPGGFDEQPGLFACWPDDASGGAVTVRLPGVGDRPAKNLEEASALLRQGRELVELKDLAEEYETFGARFFASKPEPADDEPAELACWHNGSEDKPFTVRLPGRGERTAADLKEADGLLQEGRRLL